MGCQRQQDRQREVSSESLTADMYAKNRNGDVSIDLAYKRNHCKIYAYLVKVDAFKQK